MALGLEELDRKRDLKGFGSDGKTVSIWGRGLVMVVVD